MHAMSQQGGTEAVHGRVGPGGEVKPVVLKEVLADVPVRMKEQRVQIDKHGMGILCQKIPDFLINPVHIGPALLFFRRFDDAVVDDRHMGQGRPYAFNDLQGAVDHSIGIFPPGEIIATAVERQHAWRDRVQRQGQFLQPVSGFGSAHRAVDDVVIRERTVESCPGFKN